MEKMIKSATVTYYDEYNYGAVLQAYALQQFLKSLNIDNEIINYTHCNDKILKGYPQKSIKLALYTLRYNAKLITHYGAIKNKRKKFKVFLKDNVKLTQHYNSFEELKRNPPDVDLLIAGSDQIWNVYSELRKDFFLMFGADKTIRASYAASMGRYDFSDVRTKELISAVRKFNFVSVRESEAVIYLKEIGDIDSEVLLDPTLLLSTNEWMKLKKDPDIPRLKGHKHDKQISDCICGNTKIDGRKIISSCYQDAGKYILCYPLLYHEDINKVLVKLKEDLGIPVVAISPDGTNCCYADITVRDGGPEEFVSLIANSEYVVTSSFHGTVFSILFKKPFVSYNNAANSGRIANVLDLVGLSDRFNPKTIPSRKKIIPYDTVFKIIDKEREKSKAFFKRIAEVVK